MAKLKDCCSHGVPLGSNCLVCIDLPLNRPEPTSILTRIRKALYAKLAQNQCPTHIVLSDLEYNDVIKELEDRNLDVWSNKGAEQLAAKLYGLDVIRKEKVVELQ